MNPETHKRIEAFLSNQAFQRSFEVFDTYQKLLQENVENPDKQKEIRERMELVFDKKETGDDEQMAMMMQEINTMYDVIFSLLEKGELTKEKLAEIFAASLIGERLLRTWTPEPGDRLETGNTMINEVIGYHVENEHEEVLDVNIIPTSVRGEQLWTKVFEGLHLLAEEIDHGALRQIQTIRAQSWLFTSPFFTEKLKPLLGADAALEDMPEDDGDTAQVQKLALTYHKGTLKEFLLNGTLPQIRRLQINRKEFLTKFL